MSKPLVYLAGAIAGQEYDDAADWRVKAASILEDSHNIKTLSPLRAKATLGQINNGTISKDHNHYKDCGPFFTQKGILTRDFNDVKRADILLVNLRGLENFSVGTCIELGWAYSFQKPVVVLIDKENIHHTHPMVAESLGPFQFDNLYDAIDAVHNILGEE